MGLTMKFLIVFLVTFLHGSLGQPAKSNDNVLIPRYSCPETDTDFGHHDISSTDHVVDWHACGAICELTLGCKFWTFSEGINKCSAKNSDSGLQHSNDHTSGIKGCK